MAASSRFSEEPQMHRKSLTRRQVFHAHNLKMMPAKKVPVLYYLSRNGQLDHPHLIDVPLSSPHGLYLRGNIYIHDFVLQLSKYFFVDDLISDLFWLDL